MFWNNFVLLCNKKNISPNGACADLGLSVATATKWKKGAVPRDTTLQKIADYFGVTVEYFFTDHSEEAESPVGKGVPFSKHYQSLSAEDFLKELRGMDSKLLVDLLIALNKLQYVIPEKDVEKITEEERTLLELFRQVPPDKRASFIDIARVYAMSLKRE